MFGLELTCSVWSVRDAMTFADSLSYSTHLSLDSVYTLHLPTLWSFGELMNRYLGFCSLFYSKHFLLVTNDSSLLYWSVRRTSITIHFQATQDDDFITLSLQGNTKSYGACSCHMCLAEDVIEPRKYKTALQTTELERLARIWIQRVWYKILCVLLRRSCHRHTCIQWTSDAYCWPKLGVSHRGRSNA